MITYKHEATRAMREAGELDTQIYGRIKADMAQIKKQDVTPKQFPVVNAEKISYP